VLMIANQLNTITEKELFMYTKLLLVKKIKDSE
jgi:hypothetical protein